LFQFGQQQKQLSFLSCIIRCGGSGDAGAAVVFAAAMMVVLVIVVFIALNLFHLFFLWFSSVILSLRNWKSRQ
jgi:hypothetical protein